MSTVLLNKKALAEGELAVNVYGLLWSLVVHTSPAYAADSVQLRSVVAGVGVDSYLFITSIQRSATSSAFSLAVAVIGRWLRHMRWRINGGATP